MEKPKIRTGLFEVHILEMELNLWEQNLVLICFNSSQKANDLTGEYSTIMISILKTDKMESDDWLSMYYCDFRRRLIKLLPKTFQSFTTGLALSLLDNKSVTIKNEREYYPTESTEELCISDTKLSLIC